MTSIAPLLQKSFLYFFCFIFVASTAWGASGQTLYEEGRFEEALEQFVRDQVERPDDVKTLINIGTTLYRLKRYKEAASSFARAAETKDEVLKQHALYDLGNSQFRDQAFQEAVKSYEQALMANPNDIDARENLAVAKAALEQQPKDKDKDKDNKNTDPNQSQDSDSQKSEKPSDNGDTGQRDGQQEPPKQPDAKPQDDKLGSETDPSKQEKPAQKDPPAAPAKKEDESAEKSAQSKPEGEEDSAKEGAQPTMSRARAQQLLDKLGETKTVRPDTQKALPPSGGKPW